jgi:hypothetical protein
MKPSPEISNKWTTYRSKRDILIIYNHNEDQLADRDDALHENLFA